MPGRFFSTSTASSSGSSTISGTTISAYRTLLRVASQKSESSSIRV